MSEEDPMEELYRIKEELSLKYKSCRELGDAIRQFAAEHPLPPAGSHRKLLPNFPRGQSVADVDDSMREHYETKKKIPLKGRTAARGRLAKKRPARKPSTPMRKSNLKKNA